MAGRFRYAIPALSLLCVLAFRQTASATTYTFTIPTGTQVSPDPNSVLGALSAAIANDAFHDTPSNFAFYEFYFRPQVSGDGCLISPDGCGVNLLTNYAMAGGSVTAPVPGCISPVASNCTSTYDATSNISDPVKSLASAHFLFDSGDNAVALVTTNTGAANQTYLSGVTNPFPAGAVTEIMASDANFSFTLQTSQFSSFQTPQVTFVVYGLAIQYQTGGVTALAGKSILFFGNLDLVGEAPEPSTIFIAGGGLCLLGLALWRRKVMP